MSTPEEILAHYGVKGMRWGVRRSKAERDSSRTKYKKPPAKLTDAELKRRISRMEMEKRYNELNKRDVSAGEKLATEILLSAGKSVVLATLTGAGMFVVKQAVKKKFGDEASQMIPKRKK